MLAARLRRIADDNNSGQFEVTLTIQRAADS
jgi:hypothetical protein